MSSCHVVRARGLDAGWGQSLCSQIADGGELKSELFLRNERSKNATPVFWTCVDPGLRNELVYDSSVSDLEAVQRILQIPTPQCHLRTRRFPVVRLERLAEVPSRPSPRRGPEGRSSPDPVRRLARRGRGSRYRFGSSPASFPSGLATPFNGPSSPRPVTARSGPPLASPSA
jgi:hypothetical protein